MKRSMIAAKVTAAMLSVAMLGGLTAVSLMPDGGELFTAKAVTGDISDGDVISYKENTDRTYSVCAIYPENANGTEIVIPEVFDGKMVTGIKSDVSLSGDSKKEFSLVIGRNIREIEPYALQNLKITTVSVDERSNYFTEKDNVVYTKNMDTVVYCPSAAAGRISIASGAETIREDAFTSPYIEEIYIGHDIVSIPEDAFSHCTGIIRFSLNSKNKNFSVVNGVLLDAAQTTVFAYPKARKAAFEIPDTVTEIKPYAFAGSKIPSLSFSNIKRIGKYAFEGCKELKSAVIYNTIEEIGEGAFADCTGMTMARLMNGIKSVPAGMFRNCTALTSISIPTSVISMGVGALDNTKWYQKKDKGFIYISGILYGYKTDYVSTNGFGNPDKPEDLVINEGTVSIADGALYGANVTSISIPASLRYITADDIYPAYNVRKFSVDSENKYFTAKDNFLFSKTMKKLICAPSIFNSDSYTVPSTVTEIGDYAFKFNSDIKNIFISNLVVKYGIASFNNGDPERTIVCMQESAAALAAKEDNVNRLFLESGIILSSTSVTLGVGETKTLTATVTPDIASKSVKWKSSNTSVATVSGGTIKALKNGTAVITVTESSGKSVSCTVTVKNAPSKVNMSKSEITVGIGETVYLNSSVDDGSASASRTYTSSDTSVVTISDKSWNCCFTARKTGTAVITVKTYNGKTAQCKVTVKAAPTSVSLSKTQITIGVGETVTISSTVNSNAAAYSRTYVSNNSNRAEIVPTSWNCTFTGISAGTAVITVKTYNGKTAQCKVTVKSPPRYVNMEKGEVSIGVGENMTLGSILLDTEGSANRTYRTSNSSVVKMTKTSWTAGFTGVKTGTAYVTVKTYNDQEGSCKVNVKAAPTSVTISKSVLYMKVGDKAVLTSSVPSGTAATDRVYRTSDSSVVKMTRTSWQGEFTALKAGTCWVTVRTYNGKESSCKVVVS